MVEQKNIERFHLLRGKVAIWQSREGLRAGSDAVLLSAVPYQAKKVLELGCGVGQAALCYGYREQQSYIYGIEQQAEWATLAEKNIAENGFSERMKVICADFSDKTKAKDADISSDSVDLVMMNPPYYERSAFTSPKTQARGLTHMEELPLESWIDHGLRYLQQYGLFAMIHLPERLPEILSKLEPRAGDITVLPIYSRKAQPAKRVIVYAYKSRKGKLRLAEGLVMHDEGGYSAQANRILEGAEALPIDLPFTSKAKS